MNSAKQLYEFMERNSKLFDMFLDENKFQALYNGAEEINLETALQNVENALAVFQGRAPVTVKTTSSVSSLASKEHVAWYDGATNQYLIPITRESGFSLLKKLYHETEHASQLHSKYRTADQKQMSQISAALYESNTESPEYKNNYNEVLARTAEARFCLSAIQYQEARQEPTKENINKRIVVAEPHANALIDGVAINEMQRLNDENIQQLTPKKGFLSRFRKLTSDEIKAEGNAKFLADKGMQLYEEAVKDMNAVHKALIDKAKGMQSQLANIEESERKVMALERQKRCASELIKKNPAMIIIDGGRHISKNRCSLSQEHACADIMKRVDSHQLHNPVIVKENGELYLSWDNSPCDRAYYPRTHADEWVCANAWVLPSQTIQTLLYFVLMNNVLSNQKKIEENLAKMVSPPMGPFSSHNKTTVSIEKPENRGDPVQVQFNPQTRKCVIRGSLTNRAAICVSYLKTMAKESYKMSQAIGTSARIRLMLQIDDYCKGADVASNSSSRYSEVLASVYAGKMLSEFVNAACEAACDNANREVTRLRSYGTSSLRGLKDIYQLFSQYQSSLQAIQSELQSIDINEMYAISAKNLEMLKTEGGHDVPIKTLGEISPGKEMQHAATFLNQYGPCLCDCLVSDAQAISGEIAKALDKSARYVDAIKQTIEQAELYLETQNDSDYPEKIFEDSEEVLD